MKTIAIGFSRPKKFMILSWFIRKIQHTDYSHVYIKFTSDKYKRNLIYQASGLQVNFVGEQVFADHCEVVKECQLQVSDEIYHKMMTFAIDKAGYPYSLKQLFNIVIYTWTGKAHVLGSGRSAYVCSELAGEMLKTILNVSISEDLDIITPKDVDDALHEAGLWQD